MDGPGSTDGQPWAPPPQLPCPGGLLPPHPPSFPRRRTPALAAPTAAPSFLPCPGGGTCCNKGRRRRHVWQEEAGVQEEGAMRAAEDRRRALGLPPPADHVAEDGVVALLRGGRKGGRRGRPRRRAGRREEEGDEIGERKREIERRERGNTDKWAHCHVASTSAKPATKTIRWSKMNGFYS